ncbi:HAMP domain-containing sensor histidine kinase [Enhygromyxa salina]|uniref:HAMP domain-containing sensor histidine kinase n=1 Tax=Enhygromyxa salina TaxID=215803 RepID=UPI0004E66D24|nr:ATP-binding protein [Enhygromyxa salina]
MRLSTRFGISVALAVLPLLGVVAFSVDRLHELARSNERLTTRRLVDARVGAEVITRLERLGEYRNKYAISSDPGYAHKIDEVAVSVDAELDRLASADLSESERLALERLQAAWSSFLARGPTSAAQDAPAALVELAREVQRSARERAGLEASVAQTLREQTGVTAVWVPALAIMLSLVLITLAVHSLRARLDQFIVGTRAVSQGEFSVQLDASGDDELGLAARAFNRMVKNLEQLEQIKADFIASVSHELRTPIVAMLETNLLLLDEVPGPLTSKQRTMLALNTQAAQRLSAMISELLDLHRLRTGIRYDFSEHDLVQLASVAAHELEAWASERSIGVRVQSVEPSITLACDRDRTIQVIQNLIENGLKYTPPGGQIEVWVRRCPTAALPAELDPRSDLPEHALLSVVDSGPGIPQADRRRVFEKFFRRQGRSSDGGIGLGLALCREIVEAHAGTIAVGDSPLGGAALHVALPIEGGPR